jgi:signal transduction histidine kinase/CheY-like chemotaxis protein
VLSAPPRIRSLAHRQALQVGLLAAGALLVSGLMEMYFSYREAMAQMQVLQATQASAAAREIDGYLNGLSDALQETTKSPWGALGFTAQRRREEYWRVMVLYPAISELKVIGSNGQELMFLSRSEPDRLADATTADSYTRNTQALRPIAATFGTPYLRNGAEPYVTLALARSGAGQERVEATLHLRVVADVLQRLDTAVAGRAYLVDQEDRLIVHPVQTEMLLARRLDSRSVVRTARAALAGPGVATTTFEAEDFEDQPVISTATFVPKSAWLLFVDQPRSLVLEPVLATLRRTAVLVAIAIVLTALISAWSGRRMARPIVELRRASARIADGDFQSPIELKTGDELELLAGDLNRMASRLGRFYEELEAQVAERTEQLVLARDVAERASQSKTRFLAAASHDLRQPMHTIGLLVGVLITRLHDAEQVAIAGKLSESVTTMERLFSSLLDISKLDAGVVRAQMQPFSVQNLLDRLAQRFELVAADKALRLRFRPRSDIVHSDPDLLERCVGNLVANALNYTPRGGVLVGCRRRGQQLAIQVHDTGVGIADGQLNEIFDEFIRLPGSELSQARGLGLGLAIVKRTAELLGHSVNVRSRPQCGSMFEMVVPLISAGAGAAASDRDAISPAGLLNNLFALIVDDDAGNCGALQALCTGWGCLVAAAASSELALQELGRHLRPPEIVLTDLMSGSTIDGLALVAKVREQQEETIAALLITADTSAEVMERARAAGVAVLHKPTTPQRLHQAMCQALRPGAGVSG